MRAPPHLYSSMVDINEASNGMRAASSMSEKIDQVSPETFAAVAVVAGENDFCLTL